MTMGVVNVSARHNLQAVTAIACYYTNRRVYESYDESRMSGNVEVGNFVGPVNV